MTFRNIEIFLSICENENSVTKAAQKLMISQPSATAALKDIENELGVPLFDRLGRKLYLNEAGKKFQDYALRIHNLEESMEQTFHEWKSHESIHMGASLTIGGRYLVPYIQKYKTDHPDVMVQSVVEPSLNLEQKILKNIIDFAIVEIPVVHPLLKEIPFLEEELVAIEPLAWPFQSMKMEELMQQPLLLRNRGSGTRDIIDEVFKEHQFFVQPVMESFSEMAIINGVEAGMAISILPYSVAAEAIRQKKVRMLSLTDVHFPQRFCVVYHKEKVLSENMLDFIQLVTGSAFCYY